MARRERRPRLERLEARLALSASAPVGKSVAGDVGAAGDVTAVQFSVAPTNLSPGRTATTFRILAVPTPGSSLAPHVTAAFGPDGKPLSIRRGADLILGPQSRALDFIKVGRPGTITIDVAGYAGTTGGFQALLSLNGDLTGSGSVSPTDLKAFTPAYTATAGGKTYNPAADANQNGFIGQGDAKAIEANISPETPRSIPLRITLKLAPGEQPAHPGVSNSGGITRLSSIVIEGRTTPYSLVFMDSSAANYKFTGPFHYADANGDFSVAEKLKAKLTNFEFLVVDPYGRHAIHAFPVLQIP